MVLGDSLSAAHRMPIDDGWVSLLQTKLSDRGCDTRVVNASISGETTLGGLNRLPKLLETHHPTMVMLELGGNDGLRGFPVSVMRDNLRQMVTLSQAAGAKVLIAGMKIPSNYGRRYTESFASSFAEVAQENDTALLPFFLEGISEDENLMQADTIHPNENAQPIMRDMIFKLVKPQLDCSER